jgi:arylsulfatase A-like enzyme
MKPFLLPGISCITAVALTGCSGMNKRPDKRPDIVFILADDLGYSDLGCYGQKIIETPNIDALASRGTRFTQYYSGSPVSAPTRCVILTGRHTGHSFIRGNHEWPERGDVWNFSKMEEDPSLEGQYPLKEGTVTFSSILRNSGYRTACIGKWGLGAPFSSGEPGKQGFDLFFGYNCQRQAHTYYPTHLWRNEEKVMLRNPFVAPHTRQLDGDGDPAKSESYARYNLKDYAPELMLSEALSFIRSSEDEPFFLYYTTTIPHVPLQAPSEWVEKYREKIGDEKPYTGDKGYFPCQHPMATYAAMISYLDYQVGKIIDELKKQGRYENTIFIFASDNGPVTTGGSVSDFFQNARPFNESPDRLKGSVYEGGIRVPLIISWPSGNNKPAVSDLVCAAWDMFPTICDVAGLDHPDGLDGISILPEVTGKGRQAKHEYLYWEYPENKGQQAVRMENWKGIRDSTHYGRMRIQLYDLDNDKTEESDLSGEYPEIVKRIETIMASEHQAPEIRQFDIFRSN